MTTTLWLVTYIVRKIVYREVLHRTKWYFTIFTVNCNCNDLQSYLLNKHPMFNLQNIKLVLKSCLLSLTYILFSEWWSYAGNRRQRDFTWLYLTKKVCSRNSDCFIASPTVQCLTCEKSNVLSLLLKVECPALTTKLSYCRPGRIISGQPFKSLPHTCRDALQPDLLSSKCSVVILLNWQHLRDTDGTHSTSRTHFTWADVVTTRYPWEFAAV